MKKSFLGLFIICIIEATLFQSCDEEDRPVFPLSATIFHSIDGKQVAFTALTHSAVSWLWDFGDGINSKHAMNATHTFANPGVYNVTLTVTNKEGNNTIQKSDYINVTT